MVFNDIKQLVVIVVLKDVAQLAMLSCNVACPSQFIYVVWSTIITISVPEILNLGEKSLWKCTSTFSFIVNAISDLYILQQWEAVQAELLFNCQGFGIYQSFKNEV